MLEFDFKTSLVTEGGQNIVRFQGSFPKEGIYGLSGTSGSGKSTLLRGISSSDLIFNSAIFYRGQPVDISQKFVFHIFQNISFPPHLNLESQWDLVGNKWWREEDNCIKDLGLLTLLKSYPMQISRGQLKRMALVAAFRSKRKILLLDEVFSALDEDNKKIMISYIKKWQNETGALVILTDHDSSFLEYNTQQVFPLSDFAKSSF